MRIELRQLQQQVDITAIYVTHDQEAMVLSDRVIVMYAGHIQQVDSPREVYTRHINRFVAEFVSFTNFIPGTVGGPADGVPQVHAGWWARARLRLRAAGCDGQGGRAGCAQ